MAREPAEKALESRMEVYFLPLIVENSLLDRPAGKLSCAFLYQRLKHPRTFYEVRKKIYSSQVLHKYIYLDDKPPSAGSDSWLRQAG